MTSRTNGRPSTPHSFASTVETTIGPGDSSLLQPARVPKDARSMSSTSLYPPRGQSLGVSGPPPGSFSSEMRSSTSRAETPRPDFARQDSSYDGGGAGEDARSVSEKRQAEITREIDKETKIKEGSENLLEALSSKSAKQFKEQKQRVEAELNTSNRKLAELRQGLETEIQRAKVSQQEGQGRLSFLFGTTTGRPASRQTYQGEEYEVEEEEAESPTYVLSEILQALEAEGMSPEYYVGYANRLVELFKRNPTLKYDLVWSIFGLRMQTLLLSDSREVVAAGYRVLRYSITDRRSLRIIRELHTDYLVILSLVKEGKASVEREQALKFVRAFLDVKDGIQEISRAVIRIIVAVAEHSDDRLRNIAILTLAEILVRDPPKLVEAGGMGTLTDALGDGNYRAAQSLVGAFLFLLDTPRRRKFLRSGHELEMPLATFTESPVGHVHEEKLKASGKVISALLRSWPGLITFSMNDFLAIRSLVASMYIPLVHVRHQLLDLIIDILRIKSPSWGSSFVAGRRLTTYARVTNLKTQTPSVDNVETEEETDQRNLVEHFTAVVLGVFLHAGLLEALLHAEEDALSMPLKRKTTLVLGEVLKAANELLPNQWSAKLQVLPNLLRTATKIDIDARFLAMGTIYQIDSVNRTLYRSDPGAVASKSTNTTEAEINRQSAEQAKAQQGMQMDETQFRNLMLDTGCLSTINWLKWRWDIIQNLIDGPLRNPKRLDEAMRSTKLLHRLLGFYRPFKYRFADIKNTKPNQRYVRIGCALFQCLLLNPEGVKYLAEDKVIRQLAECLSHFDRMSGLTSETPMFTESRMNETLTGGYFQLLGALTKDARGLQILERWRIFNMFYHIVELRDRDDLVKMLLGSMDYNIDSHLRIILSKAMTTGSKSIRIFATRVLRRYATRTISDTTAGTVEWAIRLLVTQLYDPEIEVCEIAIKILEEACKQIHSLEYIVKCRPALDHLGEIGAPLLLRFLSTSVGYKYLDELDYITREMDDWFLGRNDSYVALIEASLARALADVPDKQSAAASQQQATTGVFDDNLPPETLEYGIVPPHFYRELTRTREGCALLDAKGHFDEFVATVKDLGMEEEDAELILKVKGCLWAIGNVGSMELGARFLEHSDIVRCIVDIAERSQVMTMRGTAFFALGLVSRSLHGQEILAEYGWDGAVNMRGESLGFCVPLEFGKLFAIRPWKAMGGGAVAGAGGAVAKRPELKAIEGTNDPIEARILKSVTDLGNTVLAKKAAGDLHRYVFLTFLSLAWGEEGSKKKSKLTKFICAASKRRTRSVSSARASSSASSASSSCTISACRSADSSSISSIRRSCGGSCLRKKSRKLTMKTSRMMMTRLLCSMTTMTTMGSGGWRGLLVVGVRRLRILLKKKKRMMMRMRRCLGMVMGWVWRVVVAVGWGLGGRRWT
jgi:rapamycin-insensitive companion of mTOR